MEDILGRSLRGVYYAPINSQSSVVFFCLYDVVPYQLN
jgi:hypothetical protein